jgi:hypothetical protein
MRALAVLLAIVLAFGAAVMIIVGFDLADGVTCDEFVDLSDEEKVEQEFECYDLSSTQKSIGAGLAWAAGIVGALAVLAALFLAVTGRGARTFGRLTVAAVVLVGIYFLVGAF